MMKHTCDWSLACFFSAFDITSLSVESMMNNTHQNTTCAIISWKLIIRKLYSSSTFLATWYWECCNNERYFGNYIILNAYTTVAWYKYFHVRSKVRGLVWLSVRGWNIAQSTANGLASKNGLSLLRYGKKVVLIYLNWTSYQFRLLSVIRFTSHQICLCVWCV